MRIRRLKLSGFKSFVEPAELRIEPGLTGVVGPNGCGKSNLLEAIRWVMGESSPKSMRGGGMEDVIFAGTEGRPPRAFAEVVLLATGRRPYLDGLGLEAAGVALTDRGQVKIDKHWATNVPGIYAIGDAVPGPIYTSPEVASVGLTEAAAKETGRKIKVGKFPFLGNARAKAMFQGDGFVKIIADADTDRVLGAHIIGPNAGEMIHEVCVAMEFGASAEDIAMTCHAHPTTSEAVREAALALGGGAIHV